MKKQSKRKQILQMLSPYTKTLKGRIVAICILKIVIFGLTVAQPFVFSLLVDRGLVELDFDLVLLSCGLLLCIVVVNFAFGFFQTRQELKFDNFVLLRLRQDIFERYLDTQYEEYSNIDIAMLKMTIEDYTVDLGSFYTDYHIDYLFHLLLSIAYFVLILAINPILTLSLIALIPFVLWCNMQIAKKSAKHYKRLQKPYQACYGTVASCITKWKEIKSLGIEKEMQAIHDKRLNDIKANQLPYSMSQGAVGAFNFFRDSYATNVVVFFAATYFVITGHTTLGILMAFMVYFLSLFKSVGVVIDKQANIKTIEISQDFVQQIFELDKIQDKIMEVNEFVFKDKIEIKNITFGYKNRHSKVIDKVSLSIKKGEFVGIVGKSGCGKSTLIKLLVGLYYPQQGKIMIDGVDLDTIKRESLYGNVSVVLQENLALNMTIEENLRTIKPDATRDDIDKALSKAGLYDFVKNLPDKYDTIIGERGVKLSGGERQRLLIAQALIKQPQVLILDEPTSSLDGNTESEILETILSLKGDMTIIMIAHRTSTLKDADRVLSW